MLPKSRAAAVSLLISTALLMGCQVDSPLPTASKAGFKANYLVARTALERGQFGKAERSYANLMKQAGPLQARIRLEYAHALLRGGKFEKASGEARQVASELTGRGRSAALAVQATADQELARRSINKGIADSAAIQRLIAARDGFDELLKNHPDMDPLGALALRRKAIDVELSTIN